MGLRLQLVLCMVLASGCARTFLGHDATTGSTLAGDSIESGGGSPVPQHAAAVAAPLLNPTLVDDAPPSVISAYKGLLLSPKQALGTACGPAGSPTDAWSALSELVNANRADMLRDLSTRATTAEARAAAIIGLAKLRSVSYANAEYMLRRLPGTLALLPGSWSGQICEALDRAA